MKQKRTVPLVKDIADFDEELSTAKSVILAYAVIADYANAVGKRPDDVFDVLGMMFEAMFGEGDKNDR